MKQRSISAVGVGIVGIVPALMGGPVFAAVIAALCLIGMQEFLTMSRAFGRPMGWIALAAVPALTLAALLDGESQALLAVCAMVVGLTIVLAMFRPSLDGSIVDWSLTVVASMYVGLPLFAVIALRQSAGTIDANWLDSVAGKMSLGWEAHPRGLAWVLFVIMVTWLSDTGAYMVGRAAGKRLLIPRISPKKTIEGLGGGLACAGITAVIAAQVLGLEIDWWVALGVGLILAAVGVFGDLAESLIKRQAGVKDSSTLIPGHGGMLDRLDAMFFTWTAGWFLASAVDRWL